MLSDLTDLVFTRLREYDHPTFGLSDPVVYDSSSSAFFCGPFALLILEEGRSGVVRTTIGEIRREAARRAILSDGQPSNNYIG